MFEGSSGINSFNKANVERKIPVFIIDGAVEVTCPFRVCVTDNAVVF